MPVVQTRLHGRDDDTSSTSVGPGQRVSIDGGIDSGRNIIAMILATVLFIVVVVMYQYMTIVIERREAQRPKTRTRYKHPKSQPHTSMASQIPTLLRGFMSFLKRVVSPRTKASNTSSSDSMEALMKVTPRRPPQRRTFPNLPCIGRRKEYSKSKKEARRVLRPLLLNSEVGYAPRSPIDEKTQALLRSPDAFAEFSDPVRNMNFVRVKTEFQRRKERDESIWFEEPLDGPDKPVVACITPLAIRKKSSFCRDGDGTDSEQAQLLSARVIYPPRAPATPPQPVRDEQSLLAHPPYLHRQLSVIREEPESPAPRSFFEMDDDDDDDDDDEGKVRHKKVRLRFPLPSPTKASLHEDIDVFSIGSFSDSDGSSEGSGH